MSSRTSLLFLVPLASVLLFAITAPAEGKKWDKELKDWQKRQEKLFEQQRKGADEEYKTWKKAKEKWNKWQEKSDPKSYREWRDAYDDWLAERNEWGYRSWHPDVRRAYPPAPPHYPPAPPYYPPPPAYAY